MIIFYSNTNINYHYQMEIIFILVKFKSNVDLKINDLYRRLTSNT